MIFFTSDTHFGHTNIIKYDNRPFSSIKEHDEIIIKNWNSVVSSRDKVYHLGDFSFYYRKERLKKLVESLNGQIFLIRGNHDNKAIKTEEEKCFGWVKNMYTLNTTLSDNKKKRIILCHYAMRTWSSKHYGTWHLYGHSHMNLPEDESKSFDVCIIGNNYYPYSLEEIERKINEKYIIQTF